MNNQTSNEVARKARDAAGRTNPPMSKDTLLLACADEIERLQRENTRLHNDNIDLLEHVPRAVLDEFREDYTERRPADEPAAVPNQLADELAEFAENLDASHLIDVELLYRVEAVLRANQPMTEVGEMIAIDNHLGTVFVQMNEKRSLMPTGTKLYARLSQTKEESNDAR